MTLNYLPHTVDKVGDFWEVFDTQNKITAAVSEDRNQAIITRNYLNNIVHFRVSEGKIVESIWEMPDVLKFPMEETIDV